MAAPLDLDPSSSVLAFFGSELRRYRESAGLSQERLGVVINYTGALVGMIETAKRTPTREFAEACDVALNTDGTLSRLWPLVNRLNYPKWFRPFVEHESTATSIHTWEPQIIPGLLQTGAYAHALLMACWSEDADQKVAARLERQRILTGPKPPELWAIVDESAIRRRVGGSAVMREQLALLSESASRRVVLQVMPLEIGAHAGTDGGMTIFGFRDAPDVVYAETPTDGQLTGDADIVARCRFRYDLLRAGALSPEASTELIRAALEEI
jgi:transcriptional regulator with XRE-family HTH domain